MSVRPVVSTLGRYSLRRDVRANGESGASGSVIDVFCQHAGVACSAMPGSPVPSSFGRGGDGHKATW